MISALVILFTLFAAHVRSDQECSFKDTEAGYKASWVYDAQNKRVQFTIESRQRSPDIPWTGIGIGQTMKGGDMIVITNNGGRLSATDRHGIDYSEPLLDAQQDIQNFVGKIENGILSATFYRAITTNDREDNPLEDPKLNNCQYFIFPTRGGPVNANGGLEKHVSRPVTKLICNISRCTGAPEGHNPTTPGVRSALSNNALAEEVARDAVVSNRSLTPRPQPGAPTTPPTGQSAIQPGGAAPNLNAAGAPQSGPQPGQAAGAAAGPSDIPNSVVRASQPSAAGAGAAAAAAGAESAAACEYVEGKYKIQWFYTEATKRLTFTLDAPLPAARWAGIGFGQLMQNSDIIIIQDNNGLKATDRHANGHVEPILDAQQDIEAFKGTLNGGILHATFNRLLNTNDKDDLAIDDEAQNNCQYFMFPVVGGSVDEQGRIQVHDSTPKVKLICNAKSCKKPVDAAAAGTGAAEGSDGSASATGGSETGAAGAAGSVGGAGNGRSGGVTPGGTVGQNQPGPGTSGENPSVNGGSVSSGQPAGGQQQSGTAGGQQQQPGSGGGQSISAAGGAAGGAANGGQATNTNREPADGGSAGGQSQPGAESVQGAQAAGRRCPVRKDHHLCAQYVDDYLSVVYSRFPKTDVITNKACGLLATNQEGVVLRECCHYLASQCGRFIDQNIAGLASSATSAGGGASAPVPVTNGAVPPAGGAAGVPPAVTTSLPIGGAGNGASGISGRGGPVGSVVTPSTEPDTPANPAAAGANTPPALQPANPNAAAPNPNPNPNANPSLNPNPSGSLNPNPAVAPNRPPIASAADRGPEVQPAPPSAHSGVPQPAAGSAASPNSPEAKSGIPPSAAAPRRPLPNDPSQPDAVGKPGAKP